MSNYSASYNFPNGFLWGSAVTDNFVNDRNYPQTIYKLKEKFVQAISITLKWSDFEPLKNNYDENLIDFTRTLLSRVQSQNLESLILFDVSNVPQWQNLEHNTKDKFFITEKFNFITHLANAFTPYTNYYCITLPEKAFISDKQMKAELDTQKSIRDYILSLKNYTKIGIAFPSGALDKKKGLFQNMFRLNNERLLKNISSDFIGIDADSLIYEEIQKIFIRNKKPLFILSDRLNRIQSNERNNELIKIIFDMWHFYQRNWQILGYFTAINFFDDFDASDFFSNVCKNNSLVLNTNSSNLPDNWIRFLKD